VADLSTARQRRRRSFKLGTGAVAAAFVVVAAGASVTALVTNANKDAGSNTAAGTLPDDGAAPAPSQTGGPPVIGIPSYTKKTLRGSIGSISRSSAVDEITRLGETGPAGVMADTGRRRACEQSITQHKGQLVAVRRIVYEGKPAYVFVFTDLATGEQNSFVVSTDCGTTGSLSATVYDSVQ
jgi:hypothetical protein